jgi:hypothetical protein
MRRVRITNDRIRVGKWFSVDFQRTLRIPNDGREHPLPPGFGAFPLRHVRDYRDRVPGAWRETDGVMLPMHRHEALWLSFYRSVSWHPVAVKVAVGGVNAISGAPHSPLLGAEPQDYMVVPDQPWLDGIKAGEGSIRQFVAAPLGERVTVEAQVTGEESVGGLQLTVVEPVAGRFPTTPPEYRMAASYSVMSLCESATPYGLGVGGRMRQKIYEDGYGIETWDQSTATSVHVHLVAAKDWKLLTGEEPPASPISVEHYNRLGLPWFALADEALVDLPVPPVLAKVVPVAF